MNLNNAALLLRDDITTIRVSPSKHEINSENKIFTYAVTHKQADYLRKSNDPTVVVDVKDRLYIGYVVEIHDEPKIDTDSDIDYKYIVQVVDRTSYNEMREIDELICEKLKTAKKRSARDQMLAALGIDDVSAVISDARRQVLEHKGDSE